MIWVWVPSEGSNEAEAEMDYLASTPGSSAVDARMYKRIEPDFKVVYRANLGLKRMRKFRSLPAVTTPVVDKACEEIIRRFVPDDQLQFYPITLIARGEKTQEFSWVVILNKVRCVDYERSIIPRKTVKAEYTVIHEIHKLVLKPNSIGNLHLALEDESGKTLVSNELRNALCEIVDPRQFCAPENIPTLFNLRDRMDAANSSKH